MQRCSERAFEMCPNRHLCGTIHEAIFTDNSDCAEFNRKADSMPITNADRIRAMSDEGLAKEFADCAIGLYCDTRKKGLPELPESVKREVFDSLLEWLKQPAEVDNDGN